MTLLWTRTWDTLGASAMPLAVLARASGACALVLGIADPFAAEPSPRVRVLGLTADGAESQLLDARANSGFAAMAGTPGGGLLVGLSDVRDAALVDVESGASSTLAVLEVGPAGEVVRVLRLTSNQPGAVLTAMHTDGSGRVLVAGRFRGRLSVAPDVSLQADLQSGDVFLACFDTGGALLWARTGGARGGLIRALGARPDGNMVATGWFARSLSFGEERISAVGSRDAFAAVLTTEGQCARLVRFGGSGCGLDLTGAVGPTGGVTLGGSATGSFALGDVWVEGADPQAAIVVQLDANLDPEWVKVFGTGRAQGISAVAARAGGGVVVAGEFEGRLDLGDGTRFAVSSRDAFAAELDANGVLVGAVTFGARGEHGATTVAVMPFGLRVGLFSTGVFSLGDPPPPNGTSAHARVVALESMSP